MENRDSTIVQNFDNRIHRYGRITMTIGTLLLLSIPFIVSLVWDIFPPMNRILSGVLSLSVIMIPIGIAEIFTYAPIIGSGGTYLGFLTGNLSNLKVPAAAMALEIAEVDPSSDDAEIFSILAVASSAIVSAVIIFLGVLLLVPLTPFLSSSVFQPAFSNVLPALFGALGAYWFMKNWKIAVTPLVFTIVVYILSDVPTAVMIPLNALLSVLAARFLYKKGKIS